MEKLILSIITLLVGAAVFIIGMNMMSSGLKKSTGRGVKRLFKRIQSNRFAGFGIGTAVTALIQSSAATGVMVIGFISAGVMTVFQGVSIILGAYVGTTATGLLASLSSVSISKYFVILAVIGVILMFFKKEIIKNIGELLAGLGILFFGLNTMSGAIMGNEDLVNAIKSFFAAVDFPLLLLLIGALITALLQSSSASIGITVAMVSTNALEFHDAIYIVLGATIGTVITLLIATIGSNVNAKRTGVIVLIIRIVSALVALAIYWPLSTYIDKGLLDMFGGNAALAVAMFHVFYNIIFMVIALQFISPLEKLAVKLIKDKEQEKMRQALKYIDNHLLNTPTIAMMQVKREIINMMSLSHENLKRGFNRILTQDPSEDKELIETEDKIDYINNQITSFLIDLTHTASESDERKIGSYFHVVNDIERIGDHAYNFYESSLKMNENDLEFSETARNEMSQMNEIIEKMFKMTLYIFRYRAITQLKALHELEDATDKLKSSLSAKHYDRITKNQCKNELTPFYSTLISELERVADHLVNIAYSIENPVGDAEEDIKK